MSDVEATAPPFRILPKLTDWNRDFWTGGARGELRFWRCQDCSFYIHPPAADLPDVPLEEHEDGSRCRGARRSRRSRSTTRPWMPGPELPYIVAIVEIVEQPSLRLTTNLVNCAPDDARIDMPVRVTFEHHPDPDGDVYLPLFEPERSEPSWTRTTIIERRACISGVGQSEIGRRLFRDPLELTLDGCLAAIEHAGLTTADIDGLSTYPGSDGHARRFLGRGRVRRDRRAAARSAVGTAAGWRRRASSVRS